MSNITISLQNLAKAAADQGDKPYDHSTALKAADLKPGDDLRLISMAWARAFPPGIETFAEWYDQVLPGFRSGNDVAALLKRAIEIEASYLPVFDLEAGEVYGVNETTLLNWIRDLVRFQPSAVKELSTPTDQELQILAKTVKKV